MTTRARKVFRQYLQACTDAQVLGVLEKERAAGRQEYAELAQQEAEHRNLETA